MYPHERSLVKRLEGKPFTLIGINSDQDRAALHKVLDKEHITWRSFWDGGSTRGPIASAWKVHSWPTLYLIDHKGIIRKKWVDSPGQEVLGREIDKLLSTVEKGQ
jgi:Thioredoxin-like